jgi:hypothetical protein
VRTRTTAEAGLALLPVDEAVMHRHEAFGVNLNVFQEKNIFAVLFPKESMRPKRIFKLQSENWQKIIEIAKEGTDSQGGQ